MSRCDVLIEIALDQTSPPAGSIAVVGGPEVVRGVIGFSGPIPFQGWLDLMAVLVEIVGAPSDEEDQFGARSQRKLGQDV